MVHSTGEDTDGRGRDALADAGEDATGDDDDFRSEWREFASRVGRVCGREGVACGGVLRGRGGWWEEEKNHPINIIYTQRNELDGQGLLCCAHHRRQHQQVDCPAATNSPCGGSPPDLSMQLFADAATCCSTKLGWVQASTCTGASTSATTATSGSLKYYADYTSGTCKKDCAVATTAPECGGVPCQLRSSTRCYLLCWQVRVDRQGPLHCHGNWRIPNKFYVDYADNACKQDCAAASGTNCAGHPGDKATQLFSTAATCCSSKLSYLNQAACVSKSTTGSAASATGSAKWYVDWSVSKCVKDCPSGGTDKECGGLAESWESAEYTSWSACCSTRLSWVKTADCHL
eukprot:CCRYP_004774-RA/>CCRYP_004774-RA protein AED:0.14 eAED:0.21 QI:0/0/0/1/1/1/3/0/345